MAAANHVPDVQRQAGLASPEDAAALSALKDEASDKHTGTRDLVGIRKQAVLATASGQLFSLHTGDGRVLWRCHLETGGMALLTVAIARLPHNKEEDTEVCQLPCSLIS